MPKYHTPQLNSFLVRVVTDEDTDVAYTPQQFYDDPSPYVAALGAPFALAARDIAFDTSQPDLDHTIKRDELPEHELVTSDEIRVTDFNGYSYELALGEPGEWPGEPVGRFVPLAHLCSVCGDVAPPGEGRSSESLDNRWPGRWCAYCVRTYKNRKQGKTPTGRPRSSSQISPHQIHEREGSRTICEFKACNRNSCRYLWVVVDSVAFLIETQAASLPLTQAGYCDAHGEMLVQEQRGFDIPPYPHCNLIGIAEKPRMVRYIEGADFNREARAIREFATANTYRARVDQMSTDGKVPEELAHALIQSSVGATVRDEEGNAVWTADEGWNEYAERAGNVIDVPPEQMQAWSDELADMREEGFTSEQIEARAQEMSLEAWSGALNRMTKGAISLINDEDD